MLQLSNRIVLYSTNFLALQALLQKISTADCARNDAAIYTCFLNGSGRYMFDCFFYNNGRDGYIDVNAMDYKEFLMFISVYDLKREVRLSVLDGFSVYVSENPTEGGLRDSRDGLNLFRLVAKSDALCAVGDVWYVKRRMECLVSEGSYDLIKGRSIISEFEFDKINAICYTKGCYPGQELIARSKYLGEIRKSIVLLSVHTDPHLHTEIYAVGVENPVGTTLSGCDNRVLAIVKKEYLRAQLKINDSPCALIELHD